MSKIWFTSDLHFYHTNIVEYTDRGVATTQDRHDEWLINLWNKQVPPDGVVYQLGDFCFNRRKIEDFNKIVSRLNGKIIHIKGNHCDRDVLKKSGQEWYDLKGKWFTMPSGEKQYIVMCHYALEIWERMQHGAICLYGHSHGNFNPKDGKRVDVGLDSAYNIFGEHRFFTLEDIERYMKKRPIAFKDHHNGETKQ